MGLPGTTPTTVLVRIIWNRSRLIVLISLCAGLLWLAPAQKTFGQTIKLVYLPGSLVQASPLAFGASGVLGIIWLIHQRATIPSWLIALYHAALVVWTSYVVSSLIVTYQTGGVAAAWGEPRLMATVRVSVALLFITSMTMLLQLPVLTAVGSIALASISLFPFGAAAIVRHTMNPIGESPSVLIPGYYIASALVIGAMAATFASIFQRS